MTTVLKIIRSDSEGLIAFTRLAARQDHRVNLADLDCPWIRHLYRTSSWTFDTLHVDESEEHMDL